MNWMIQNNMFLYTRFHYEKKDKAIITKLYNYEFPRKIQLENYLESANRFLNKVVEVETRLPCKVLETQFMWL